MAQINITFANPINISLQAKPLTDSGGNAVFGHDIIYFVKNEETQVRELGKCIGISEDRKTITAQVIGTRPVPGNQAFILFGKDTEVQTSGLDGYYAKVKMENTLTSEVELFAVGSDVVQSSK